MTLFQLGLTCYYLFLSHLSANNRDVCIGINHLNRSHPALASMIGICVNMLPCRLTVDSFEGVSLSDVARRVQQRVLDDTHHSQLPYRQILDLHRVPSAQLQVPFMQTTFRVEANAMDYANMGDMTLDGGCRLSPHDTDDYSAGGHFDLEVTLTHNIATGSMQCEWTYLLDILDESTVRSHAEAFVEMLSRLFNSDSLHQLHVPLSTIITFPPTDTIARVVCFLWCRYFRLTVLRSRISLHLHRRYRHQ